MLDIVHEIEMRLKPCSNVFSAAKVLPVLPTCLTQLVQNIQAYGTHLQSMNA